MVSWRYIVFLLTFLGLLSASVILAMLFWMTNQLEHTEHKKTYELIDLKLQDRAAALTVATEDSAFWTFAHDLVAARDDAGVLEHVGSSATASPLFDEMFILGAKGDLAYAFSQEMGANAQTRFDVGAFAPLLDALAKISPEDYISVEGLIERDGQFSFVTAAWITPDSVTQAPDAPYAAMLGVVNIDQATLNGLMRQSDITSLSLVPFSSLHQNSAAAQTLVLTAAGGQPVATLRWTLQSLGAHLRDRLLPGFLIIAISILGVCASAARYFHKQYNALEQANLVATTDQLTGVLNRAGLTERLRGKDVVRGLEKGELAAIYLDLNKFKDLNDTLGHRAGDIALRVTAERLQGAVRKSDIVARLGGDEFICVILDPKAEKAAMAVGKRILSLAKSPVSFGQSTQLVTPSVGVAMSGQGHSWETVMSHADEAMYWSKQTQADFPVVFCKSMDKATEGTSSVLSMVH